MSASREVVKWQTFLRGQDLYLGAIDGIAGPMTRAATQAFQQAHGVPVSDLVSAETLAAAQALGYEPRDIDWPSVPDFRPLTQVDRQELFGAFKYVASPVASMPEAIKVDPHWVAENIVKVALPIQGKHVLAHFHKLAAERAQRLFRIWDQEGLLDRVLTWDGSYAPRFIRGSTTVLSAHAWGTAFDINARWNALGVTPALLGASGCVRELVQSANELGFYWGGHYSRKDGMHFELTKVEET